MTATVGMRRGLDTSHNTGFTFKMKVDILDILLLSGDIPVAIFYPNNTNSKKKKSIFTKASLVGQI